MSSRKLNERQRNAGDSAVSVRLSVSAAQLRQLLALCGASLVETTRAVQELSDRVTLLREVVDVLLAEGGANANRPAMRVGDGRGVMGARTFKP